MTKFATLLLSRQSLRPTGFDGWVQETQAAIHWLKSERLGLISSTAVQTWELATALASVEQLPLKLVLLATDQCEFEQLITDSTTEFALEPSRTEFIPCWRSGEKRAAPGDYRLRDAMIVEAADLLLPVSVRPLGIMSRLIDEAVVSGRELDRQFETKYKKRTESLAYTLAGKSLNPKLSSVGPDYLIHWTRASNSAWPGERLVDYYRAVVGSTVYPRSAIDTLRHIVRSGTIIASSRHMLKGMKTVSFSEASPTEINDLIRWRARYRMMSFEPYGLGIRSELVHELGIRPVVYYDRAKERIDSTTEAWLTQSQGGKTDWRSEKEFRCLGNLDFGQVPVDQLILFCHTPEEVSQLTNEFGIKVVSFLP